MFHLLILFNFQHSDCEAGELIPDQVEHKTYRKGSVVQGKCGCDTTVCVCRWTHLEKTDDAWKVRSQHRFLLPRGAGGSCEEVFKHTSQECVWGRGQVSLSVS